MKIRIEIYNENIHCLGVCDIRDIVSLRRLILQSLECIEYCIKIVMALSKRLAILYYYNASHFLL